MTRRQTLHAAALFIFVIATVPGLALLCRGHAPSRFAPVNLPFWERTLPHPAPVRVVLRCTPAPPGAVEMTDPAFLKHLQAQNPDELFRVLEHPSKSLPSPIGAGRPGLWLQQACALGRRDARLRQQQDQIAVRLMSAQDSDGYLANGMGAGRWSARQAEAYAQNLCGLLAYYAVSHSPAAIYTAMQAGNLVVMECPRGLTEDASPDILLLPLVQLYQMTGETKYRDWAVQIADAGTADGTGLCALYQATSQARYLHSARQIWGQERVCHTPDPELAAALWTLTGAPGYVRSFAPTPVTWLCPTAPGSLAYARIPGGIAVNVCVPSHATFGAVRLTQRFLSGAGPGRTRLAAISVQVLHPTAFTLRVTVPKSGAQVTVNGIPKTIGDGVLVVTRRWRSGDEVTYSQT